jgi:hypothetical protein
MEQTQWSETSAIKHHKPENNPKVYTELNQILFFYVDKYSSYSMILLTKIINFNTVRDVVIFEQCDFILKKLRPVMSDT